MSRRANRRVLGGSTFCQLTDIGYVGCDYTWTDNCEDEVRFCLDRALATTSWLQLFPSSRVCHLNLSKLDHLPLLVEIHRLPTWLQGDGCEEVVRRVWSPPCMGVSLFQVCKKICATRVAVLSW